MTIGTAKTATIGKVLNATSTEDGSGFYSVDTTAAAFTTTLAPALIVGEQLRFKQANGSWVANAWTLTSSLASGLKFVSTAGVVGAGVTSLVLSSKNVAEVVAEWDGSAWQVAQIAAALGGLGVSQALTIATANTIPALAAPWNGVGVPTLNINGTVVANGAGVTFTSGSSAVSVSAATLGFNVNAGDTVTAAYTS